MVLMPIVSMVTQKGNDITVPILATLQKPISSSPIVDEARLKVDAGRERETRSEDASRESGANVN